MKRWVNIVLAHITLIRSPVIALYRNPEGKHDNFVNFKKKKKSIQQRGQVV